MKAKPVARRHHYVPLAYLAGFTSSGEKDGQFYALDTRSGHTFRTSPLNVGSQRDFNRVDIEGHSPDVIESALAPIEGKAVAAIQRVLETQCFPGDEDWNLILNLLGLIAVRNPKLRNSFNASREQVLRRIASLLVSDKSVWESHLSKMQEAGEVLGENVSFEDAKRFVEGEEYQIEFSPEGNLRIELSTFNEVFPLLGQRSWSVLVAPPEGPEFICSDHPVTLAWKGSHFGPLGFALRETEVFFPLGRQVGFYGVFEEPLHQVVRCGAEKVAMLNQRVASSADRHVYSALESFFVWQGGVVRTVSCKI